MLIKELAQGQKFVIPDDPNQTVWKRFDSVDEENPEVTYNVIMVGGTGNPANLNPRKEVQPI